MLEVKYSATQVADLFGADPKTFRKFLRAEVAGVGQGARYQFTEGQIEELRPKYKEWVENKNKTKKTGSSVPRARSSTKSHSDDSPMDADPIVVRSSESIVDRQRRHGIICSHLRKTRTGTVIEICRETPVKGTKFCSEHAPQVYCGEPVEAKCGPGTGRPWCLYHAGEISEEEFEAWAAENEVEL